MRQIQGIAIAKAKPRLVTQIENNLYLVKSQKGTGTYAVYKVGDDQWFCQCPDHRFRGEKCKHIWAVEYLKENRIIREVETDTCPSCNSTHLKKNGVRHNKCGDIKRYMCLDCHKTFSINLGFERMKHNPQAITTAMQLYFNGESLRNTMRSLELLGIDVSHQTVYNWIKKYIALMKNYAEKITPNVSDTWRADELFIKIRGNMKYLFAMMDDKTRFWIAQEVAETKYTHDARNLLRMSKELMGKKPMTFITDGLRIYNEAYRKEYWTLEGPRTKHVSHISLRGDHNNNKMERLNGEVRDREKVMRGLKVKETPILQGYQFFHNYIRPHEALDGKTPAEACGITVEGKNKWITLIQNASKNKT
ncbi:MAG: DDE-type integrase/transposase/recombinase [Candidatus Bathyarchaeia archaeon]|jgi:transposase-like protein